MISSASAMASVLGRRSCARRSRICCHKKLPGVLRLQLNTGLQKFVIDSISDEEFDAARVRITTEDGVTLRDKEQFFYYRVYRTILPPPRLPGTLDVVPDHRLFNQV